ncbi:MAG: hypothetical protein J0L92_10455 [Deltaproteobacteria bacterium]|nr:hypothetical protein [Deltaproteobacteria bacterium]
MIGTRGRDAALATARRIDALPPRSPVRDGRASGCHVVWDGDEIEVIATSDRRRSDEEREAARDWSSEHEVEVAASRIQRRV